MLSLARSSHAKRYHEWLIPPLGAGHDYRGGLTIYGIIKALLVGRRGLPAPREQMRANNEVLIDRVLSLFISSVADENGGISGNLKFQKLTFLSEWALIKKGIKALHLKFFRYKWGPYSKELTLDQRYLMEKGYLTGGFVLKEKATDLLEYFLSAASDSEINKEVFRTIIGTCEEYGKYTGLRLQRIVYDMKITPHDMPTATLKIADIPAFVDIFVPEVLKLTHQLELPDFLLKDIAEDFEGRELSAAEKAKLDKEIFDNLAMNLAPRMNERQKEEAKDFLTRANAPQALIRKFA